MQNIVVRAWLKHTWHVINLKHTVCRVHVSQLGDTAAHAVKPSSYGGLFVLAQGLPNVE